MRPRRAAAGVDASHLAEPAGFADRKRTLCIGLDIAWHGGSKGDKASQHDCLAAAVVDANGSVPTFEFVRVALKDRDPEATATASAIAEPAGWMEAERIVLAVDAPLQTIQPDPKPPRKRARRHCEDRMDKVRQWVDRTSGGSKGWHPTVQPGVPLAPRVVKLLAAVETSLGLHAWTRDRAQADRVAIECFPAEAIWAARRLGQYPDDLDAANARAYKTCEKRKELLLSAARVGELARTVLVDGFGNLSGIPQAWPLIVDGLVSWLCADATWKMGEQYRGGKYLDDAVDSCLCLATATAFATGRAHVWQHPDHRDDGHIMGPGRFDTTGGGSAP